MKCEEPDPWEIACRQLTFDPNPLAVEFRYRCDDPDNGFRFLLTTHEDMSCFDVPILAFPRPMVFNINDFWPGNTLNQTIELACKIARSSEEEMFSTFDEETAIQEIVQVVRQAPTQLREVEFGNDGLSTGTLFSIICAMITLCIRTNLAENNPANGIFVMPSSTATPQ